MILTSPRDWQSEAGLKNSCRRSQLEGFGRAACIILWLLVWVPHCGCGFRLQGEEEKFRQLREDMVRTQIAQSKSGAPAVRDSRVLQVMRQVPRHRFVPPAMVPYAYEDSPLPIGYGQTISEPYIVAKMTELTEAKPSDRALEVGTGSGYQAAVLASLVAEVYTIEIVEPLGIAARERLRALGYKNVEVRIGDGYQGWPEKAPFGIILVTAAAEKIPPLLIEQLKPGGRMMSGLPQQALDILTPGRPETFRATSRAFPGPTVMTT